MPNFKIGSLFSGIGGIDIGFLKAGYDVAWANEIDKYACQTYNFNFPKSRLIIGDIRKVDFSVLEDIDILTAGFPCQPFSVCGKQKGFDDDRGNLFFEIMNVADCKKPKIIFLENVANLIEHDNGRTFNIIHNELASRDYCIRYLAADACDYGLPQHRTRTYIVAFQSFKDCNQFMFPAKVDNNRKIFDVIDRNVRAQDIYYVPCKSEKYTKLNKVMTDENQIYRFSDYGIQKSTGGISFTLKANMGTWYDRIPFVRDNFGIREITPAECLALQGFPSDYGFPNIPLKEQYKQCGNTVCVPVIESIAKNILKLGY